MPTSPNSRAHTTTNTTNSNSNTNMHTNTQTTTRTRVPVPSSSQPKPSISAPSSPSTAAPRAPTTSLPSQHSPYSHRTHSQTPSQQVPPPTPVSPVLSASPSSPRALDMKRLLAKPAPPYARAHQGGSGSESEGTPGAGYSFSDGGGVNWGRRERDREMEMERTLREISFDMGAPLDLSLEQPVMETTLSRSRSRSRTRSEGTPEKVQDVDNGKHKEKEKRQRNVLRRRPSTMTISTPSSTTTTSHTTNTTTAKSKSHTATTAVSAVSTPSPQQHLTPTSTLRSPLPPLSPRSPLSPSILPTGSPSVSPAASAPTSPGHNTRPTTAPSPKSPELSPNHTQSHARPSSNTKIDIDKDTNPRTATRGGMSRSASASASVPVSTPRTRNLAYGHGHGAAAQGKVVPRAPNTPSVRVTDVDPGTMAGRVRGHPFPSSPKPSHSSSLSFSPSPSPAPSRSHSPSFRSPHHHPQHLSSTIASTRAGSAPSSRDSSRTRPSPPAPDTTGLTPAGAVVAAYKRQAAMREAAVKAAEGDYADNAPTSVVNAPSASTSLPSETRRKKRDSLKGAAGRSVSASPSESETSRVSLGLGEGGSGAGFDVIERVVVRGQGQGQATEGPHTSSTDEKKAKINKGAQKGEEESPRAPYYTVFGSSSGRVVAVGGPEDLHHLSWDISPLGPSSSLGSLGRRSTVGPGNVAPSSGGLKTLTRKVSGRWRRGASGTGGESEREFVAGQRGASLGGDRGREMMRGRPSLQERPSTASGAGGKRMKMAADRRSLRLSIDKFPEEVRVLGREREKELELSKEKEHRVLKTTKGGSPASGSPASGNTPATSPNTTSGSGSKIWKLMKRISTGGLREKYTHQDAEAPPVPALPKEYAPAVKSAEEKQLPSTPKGPTGRHAPSNSAGAATAGFGKVVRKKASIVLGVGITNTCTPTKPLPPSPNPLPRSPLPPQTTVPAARPSPPTCNARPSTTTRSSSPNSSDVASARFFFGSGNKQSASAHSSTSSLVFEEVPPMPKMNIVLGQHIIPPSELGRMHSDEGHDGSEETSHQQHQAWEQRQSQLHMSHQHQKTPSRSQSQSQLGSNNPLKKLKLVLPTSASPTKHPRRSDEWMIVHTPATELAPLPLPPRRAHQQQNRIRSDTNTPTPNTSWSGRSAGVPGDDDEHDRREELEWERMWSGGGSVDGAQVDGLEEDEAGSPVIPSFSTAGAINTFSPRRTSTDTRRSRQSPSSASTSGPTSAVSFSYHQPHHHTQQMKNLQNSILFEPPPRPSRSTQRPPPPSGSKSMPTSPINLAAITRVPVPTYDGVPASTNSNLAANPNRRSTGEHSTTSTATITNIRRRSSSYLTNSPPSSPPRAMTFREIGASGPGVVLSEQEKAERWDDLLERSARAGGTLHLDMGGRSGEHGLKSDRLRFSEISEVVSL